MKEYANKYTESRRLQIHAEQPEFFDFGPYPHSTGLKRRVRVRHGIIILAIGLAIPVAGLIKDPGGWIYLAIAAAVSALFFLGFEIEKLIRKPKDKAELNKLIQERDEIYGKLALILMAKSSYRNEQVTGQEEKT